MPSPAQTPYALDHRGVGRGVHGHGLLQEAVEQLAAVAGGPAGEPETELVLVVVEMLPADSALVRAQQPTLEERGDAVDTREHGFGGLAAAEQDPPVMVIADVGESAVALQAVRDHDGARADGLLDERQQAVRRGVGDPAQTNPTDGRAAPLRSDGNQGLLAVVATPPTGLDAAHERFVYFDLAGQAVPAGAHHGAAGRGGPRP